ncbi:MAG TPA: hypothetical protein VHR72_03195 [Gemmataceae bacterium]|jgi:hypothetical protein|nr:hypothetical protein [Gemmataceae bacterium]
MTIADLAKRLADVERKVAVLLNVPARGDWRKTVGMFEGSEFMAQLDADVFRARGGARGGPQRRIRMILLDTDHLSVLRFRYGEQCPRFVARMEAVPIKQFESMIVNVAEQMRDWL